ncbi:MAG: phosphate ABC transporter permease subunit PstC [Halothiobacillaceae bacterium]
MNTLVVLAIILAVMAVAYQFGTGKARRVQTATADGRAHSRPVYHGMKLAFWVGFPALALFVVWSIFQPNVINAIVLDSVPGEVAAQMDAVDERNALQRIYNLSTDFGVADQAEAWEVQAAETMKRLRALGHMLLAGLMAAFALIAVLVLYPKISPEKRARNHVERIVRVILILCSTVAILTTLGIILSLLGETIRFFQYIPAADFFFGTTWNPRFVTVGAEEQGRFGMLPLVAGTFMIALIAMLVAVPIGLMTAIYLSEYAPGWFRAGAKPVLEVLAGIPTIVYGFFALITVGPFLQSMGASVGLDIRATSALTAGVVMGIMLIPFISSLSDDIITQVPRSMRDGSLALGATRSETITKVILLAALPGIAGAILLAASRAIGETMIVVLAAGNAPVLTGNPFEAVSTFTVTIVNQLTGDNDFASPQSLVAFALGLTLFVITLLLNVAALMIVRRFREQYD